MIRYLVLAGALVASAACAQEATAPPRSAEVLRKNPLGIFVNAINWSKELGS